MVSDLAFRDHVHVENISFAEIIPAFWLQVVLDQTTLHALGVLVAEWHLVETIIRNPHFGFAGAHSLTPTRYQVLLFLRHSASNRLDDVLVSSCHFF